MSEMEILYSAGGQFYAISGGLRECELWLSFDKRPLPVPREWRRPDSICAMVMPGRDYYRIGMFRPAHTDGTKAISADDELVRDYRDAAWWTPGIEEAWAECTGMHTAMNEATKQIAELTRLHVCVSKGEAAGDADGASGKKTNGSSSR
jgi:hypothetical protein